MDDAQEIEELLRARSEAAVNGDLDKLDTLLTSDFKYVNRWGDVVVRSSYFRNKEAKSADSYWIGQHIDELEINMLTNDLALTTFRVLDHQMFEGKEMKDYVRTSYLCVRSGGNWQLRYGHTSLIEPE